MPPPFIVFYIFFEGINLLGFSYFSRTGRRWYIMIRYISLILDTTDLYYFCYISPPLQLTHKSPYACLWYYPHSAFKCIITCPSRQWNFLGTLGTVFIFFKGICTITYLEYFLRPSSHYLFLINGSERTELRNGVMVAWTIWVVVSYAI